MVGKIVPPTKLFYVGDMRSLASGKTASCGVALAGAGVSGILLFLSGNHESLVQAFLAGAAVSLPWWMGPASFLTILGCVVVALVAGSSSHAGEPAIPSPFVRRLAGVTAGTCFGTLWAIDPFFVMETTTRVAGAVGVVVGPLFDRTLGPLLTHAWPWVGVSAFLWVPILSGWIIGSSVMPGRPYAARGGNEH